MGHTTIEILAVILEKAGIVGAIGCVLIGVILGMVTRQREEQARAWLEKNKREESRPFE